MSGASNGAKDIHPFDEQKTEPAGRTKKVITAVDSKGNLVHPKANKDEYSSTERN